jgi:hypothetical protein
MLVLFEMVIVPPYCGVPRLSHQFPVPVVVTAAVVEVGAVAVVVATAAVVVVTAAFDVVVVAAAVAVVDDEPQDASIIVAGIKIHKSNQINLFFTFALLF